MADSLKPEDPLSKGLICQDLLLLRYLLGLRVGQPLPTVTACRELPSTLMKDVLFLAFDTENIRKGQIPLVKQFQVGISILDTRVLQDHLSSQSLATVRNEDLLRTRNFCVGPLGYCSKATRRFLFGQSEAVDPDQIKGKIESLVFDRDVVLVVHDGQNDFWLLKELNINLQPVAILDTQKAAYEIPQLHYQCSLKELLIALDCPFNFLHIAGNDANYTLRVLLMIAVRDSDGTNPDEPQQALLLFIQAIAQSTRPDNWHEKRDYVMEEHQAYVAERQKIKRRQKEKKECKKSARKLKLAAEGHWSSTKSGRQAFWAEKRKTEGG